MLVELFTSLPFQEGCRKKFGVYTIPVRLEADPSYDTLVAILKIPLLYFNTIHILILFCIDDTLYLRPRGAWPEITKRPFPRRQLSSQHNQQRHPLGLRWGGFSSHRSARRHLKQAPLALLATLGRRYDNFTCVPRRGRAVCSPEAAVTARHPPPPTHAARPGGGFAVPGPFCHQRLAPGDAKAAAAWRLFLRGPGAEPRHYGPGQTGRRGPARAAATSLGTF